jgi:hypothetical protein
MYINDTYENIFSIRTVWSCLETGVDDTCLAHKLVPIFLCVQDGNVSKEKLLNLNDKATSFQFFDDVNSSMRKKQNKSRLKAFIRHDFYYRLKFNW